MTNQEVQEELPELPELEGLITISAAAEIMGMSRQAAHRMAKSRRIAAWRIRSAGSDRPVVVRESDALAMAQAMRERVVDPQEVPA